MIENIFGQEDNTIEVCSRSVRGINGSHSSYSSSSACFTVDINPETKPDLVGDAQTLDGISDNKFDRWRCDPPYNQNTAQKMYGTNLPITGELLNELKATRIISSYVAPSFSYFKLGCYTFKGVHVISLVLLLIYSKYIIGRLVYLKYCRL